MKLTEMELQNFLLGLIGDTDALMESPLSPDDENLVENFDKDVEALDTTHHEIPANKNNLLIGEDIPMPETPEERKQSIDTKDNHESKYLDIRWF